MAITLPEVGGSQDNWGTILNAALTSIDTDVTAAEADIDTLQAQVTALQAGPSSHYASLRQTVAQSIPHNTVTAITFGIADFDRLTGWSSGTPSRYTAQAAGWYEATGGVAYASNATGARAVHITKNGSGTPLNGSGTYLTSTASPVVATRPTPVQLIVGDYLQLTTFQSSGGALNTDIASPYMATMHIKYLGPA